MAQENPKKHTHKPCDACVEYIKSTGALKGINGQLKIENEALRTKKDRIHREKEELCEQNIRLRAQIEQFQQQQQQVTGNWYGSNGNFGSRLTEISIGHSTVKNEIKTEYPKNFT